MVKPIMINQISDSRYKAALEVKLGSGLSVEVEATFVLVGVPGKVDANNGNDVLVLDGWTVGLVDILAAESFWVGAKSRRL